MYNVDITYKCCTPTVYNIYLLCICIIIIIITVYAESTLKISHFDRRMHSGSLLDGVRSGSSG